MKLIFMNMILNGMIGTKAKVVGPVSGWTENSLQKAYENRFVENNEKYLVKNWFEKQHKYTYRESRGLDEDGIFLDTW